VVALVSTVAYLGLDARAVEVQCQVAPGVPKFNVVGLPDKAVGESRERVHSALAAMGLALPPKRITINLSPADLPKEGRFLRNGTSTIGRILSQKQWVSPIEFGSRLSLMIRWASR